MANHAANLRDSLATSAKAFANHEKVPYYTSLGKRPAILFHPFEKDRRHGNFTQRAYARIRKNVEWQDRLCKPHPQRSALPEKWRQTACESDSCNSSDALLMNLF